jgi:glycerophosphoryl diester phosphodiesterase
VLRSQFPLAFLAATTIAVGAAVAQEAAEWNLRDHIALDDVVVQSHRGAGSLTAENSLEAFDVAWGLGTVPEADLRTSRDGQIVAFHDEDFRRILPHAPPEIQRRGVAEFTWDELRQLDVGSWKDDAAAGQRIARLSDVYPLLQANPRRLLYIDVKNVDLPQLAAESSAVHAQLILASTKYEFIRAWKRLAPGSATLHWMGGTEPELSKRLDALKVTGFADITQLQIHVRTAANGTLTPSPKFLAATGRVLRSHGVVYQVLPWGRNDPEVFRNMMDLGVASFATDYPDVAMQTIREYYAECTPAPTP